MAEADGDERLAIRTEVAQVLRTTLARIAFGRYRIVGHYHDARLRYRTVRPRPNWSLPMPANKITLFDDAPVMMDARDIAISDDMADVLSTPLPPGWGKPRP
ncbi:hypothetical protein MMSR116_02185 [Methylobacterium mesophilicum SR1.6/6]|uniref:Uncharacterized protein n=1 Tax=Methylobacterium mesophilicum SR1.6/6 TaxID=908290 RepID=A0A6B9FI35_9HYPH|nr:hypothetical protein [Methylobacterium mesophilicum]QGY00845.1 hypothetical protein MMSR116_02185 [Methylobacterium mesophilicum SR1.6/6]